MSFSDGMRAERKRQRLSQMDLSRLSNVSQQSISAIETGLSEPTERTMIMIASALGCSVGKLLGEIPNKNSSPVSPDELDLLLYDAMVGLDHADFQRVLDFVAGLKAARTAPPSQQR